MSCDSFFGWQPINIGERGSSILVTSASLSNEDGNLDVVGSYLGMAELLLLEKSCATKNEANSCTRDVSICTQKIDIGT